MAVSEPDRQELFQALEGAIGKRPTETMMALLPPVGWADVATKRDLEQLAVATKRDLEHVETTLRTEMKAMESRINERIMRTALTVNLPAILAAVALSFAATQLG